MKFIRCVLIRATKTFCQSLIAVIGVDMVVTEIDWKYSILTALTAFILSIITSIATGLPEVDQNVQRIDEN